MLQFTLHHHFNHVQYVYFQQNTELKIYMTEQKLFWYEQNIFLNYQFSKTKAVWYFFFLYEGFQMPKL